MPGHLFVVRGDLTRLACDAWLLPTGRGLHIREHWLRNAPQSLRDRGRPLANVASLDWADPGTREFRGELGEPDGWYERRTRTFEIDETLWPSVEGHGRPWATQVVVPTWWDAADRADSCAEGARAFVTAAASELRGRKPAFGRHRPLLALPVVGTGAGGGWNVAGQIVRRLVGVLLETLRTIDADVVIVTNSGDQFAAVQHERRAWEADPKLNPWSALDARLRAEGAVLAEHARNGQLVFFLGAGVSVSAGLPTWGGLLKSLAAKAGLTASEQEALWQLPVLDQARIIRDRLEHGPDGVQRDGALAQAIVAETSQTQYGLTHALLASTPARESVTTNYDTLFEIASNSAGATIAVLPYSSVAGARRWLLKMHGCISHPNDIVLTREDFLRYAANRGALAAIVQALLITRHMLFIGFSLSDDNFLRIADEVRKVVRLPSALDPSGRHGPFGTALLLSHSQLLPSLWAGDINCIAMSEQQLPQSASDADKAAANSAAANQLEILLDYILAESSQHIAHLLDDRYEHLLSSDEVNLRNALRTVQQAAAQSKTLTNLPAWKPIQALLDSLGGRADV